MKKFLSIIISLILILILAFLIILLPLNNLLKKDNVKRIVNNIQIEEQIEQDENFAKVIDKIFEPLYIEAKKYNISDKYIIKIMDSEEVKNLIGSITSNIIDYVITGNDQKIISNIDINNVISNSIDKINRNYLIFTEENKQNILQIVDKKINEYQDIIPNTKEVEENLNSNTLKILNVMRSLFASKLIIFLIVTVIILTLVIILLNLEKFKWLKYIGVNLFIASLISLLGNILINLIIKNNYNYLYDLLGSNFPFNISLSVSLILLSFLMLTIYYLFNKKSQNS